MRRITKFSLLLSLVLGLYFPTVFAVEHDERNV